MSEIETPKLITRESRDRIIDADRLINILYSDLEDYRRREGLEQLELINLAQDARKLLIQAGAQIADYIPHGSLGPGRWGSKTTVCVPPEWIIDDEDQKQKAFDLFDFVKSKESHDDDDDNPYQITPLLVFKRGAGYEPVCIYKLDDNVNHGEYILLANLYDYVKAISKL